MLAIEDRQDRSGASARIHSQAALGPSRRRGLNGGGNRGNPWFPCSYHGGGNGGTPGSPVRISTSDARRIPLFANAVFLARDELENVRLVAPEEQRHKTNILKLVAGRSEEHTSELQSPCNLVCRLLL